MTKYSTYKYFYEVALCKNSCENKVSIPCIFARFVRFVNELSVTDDTTLKVSHERQQNRMSTTSFLFLQCMYSGRYASFCLQCLLLKTHRNG
jgi:hypothetical protein